MILVKTLLVILFFCIPIIHSHIFDYIGYDLKSYVDGNFEFTKSMFFNVLSGLIFIIFSIFGIVQKRLLIISKSAIFILGIIIISNIVSISTYTSLFGTVDKGHGSLLFLNLVGIFLVLTNLEKKFIKKLFFTSIISAFFVSIISIYEYIIPSFNYGDLGNRALGSFGHPNYLILFLLLSLPYLFKKITKNKLFLLFLLPILISIILTKSVWGILIFLIYSIYCLFFINKKTNKKSISLFLICGFFIIGLIIYKFGFYTKLHSFLSRFYIWETIIKIIFSDFKLLSFGAGADSLSYYFDNFKSPFLYIFENFGYTADRPHNLFLNILFHFGLLGFITFLYFLRKFYKKFNNNISHHAVIIFLIFTIFNFASIASYLLIILYIAYKNKNTKLSNNVIINFSLISLGIFSLYFSTLYYYSETLAYKSKYIEAVKSFPYNTQNYYSLGQFKYLEKIEGFKSEQYHIAKITNTLNLKKDCVDFIENYYTAENLFYCGDLLWEAKSIELSKVFYKKGLDLIPDLWNKKSIYYNNKLISNYVDGVRFFSPKYSNISEILKRVGLENFYTK